MNYAVSEKEAGCDDIDMDDKEDRSDRGDGVFRLITRQGLYGNGLHWALLGCSRLYCALLKTMQNFVCFICIFTFVAN